MAKLQNQFYENKYLSNLGIAKIKELYNNKIPKSNQNIQLKAQVNQILNKKAKKLSEKRALELKAKLVNLSAEEKNQLKKLKLNNIAANMNYMNLRKRNTLPSISAPQSA
jgi:glycine cleavage system pyridoxal-binding protein P